MGTHNNYLGSKVRKDEYKCKPLFYCIKVVYSPISKSIIVYFSDEIHIEFQHYIVRERISTLHRPRKNFNITSSENPIKGLMIKLTCK